MADGQTVTTPTETPAAPAATGSAAFDAARASIAARESKASDDTPVETPAQEPAKVADEPTDATETPSDALELTDEEIKQLSPKDLGTYRKLQKAYTQRSQEHSALKKQFDPWKPLIDAVSADPDKALERLAKERGYTLSRATQDNAVREHTAETVGALPEELQFLEPILKARDQQLMDKIERQIAPMRRTTDAIVSEAAAAETAGTMRAFEAKHPDWKQHEGKMLEIGQKFVPVPGTMTDFEYTEMLYRLATADVTKAEQTRSVIEKINKSAANAEPATPGMNSQRVEHTLPPEGERDIRAAFRAAKNGIVWSK